jgi:hypothetical protein
MLSKILTLLKSIIIKFKRKMWSNMDIENKINLNYYKEIINPKLKYKNYPSVDFSSRKKIYIENIRTNSHKNHNETERWARPKTP